MGHWTKHLRRQILEDFIDAARFRGATEAAVSAADYREEAQATREEAAERFRAQRNEDPSVVARRRQSVKFIRYTNETKGDAA